MGIVKAVVLKINGYQATVLAEGGRFLTIPNHNYTVGQEIEIAERRPAKPLVRSLSLAAALIIGVIGLAVGFGRRNLIQENEPQSQGTSVPTVVETKSPEVTESPSPEVSPTPVQTSTPTPTAAPTATPTPTPTAAPTATPTPSPEVSPTPVQTSTPTPTAAPTATPTRMPTAAPTATPIPTAVPTIRPTVIPTDVPRKVPSTVPGSNPESRIVPDSNGQDVNRDSEEPVMPETEQQMVPDRDRMNREGMNNEGAAAPENRNGQEAPPRGNPGQNTDGNAGGMNRNNREGNSSRPGAPGEMRNDGGMPPGGRP